MPNNLGSGGSPAESIPKSIRSFRYLGQQRYGLDNFCWGNRVRGIFPNSFYEGQKQPEMWNCSIWDSSWEKSSYLAETEFDHPPRVSNASVNRGVMAWQYAETVREKIQRESPRLAQHLHFCSCRLGIQNKLKETTASILVQSAEHHVL